MTSAEDTFSDLVGSLDAPMFIVTTTAPDGERSGCLVGFATQCSIRPPRFLACISVVNHTAGVAARATYAAVHVVGDDTRQRELAELFGGETGDEVDKFSQCRWSPGVGGVPVLDDVQGWFVGKVVERVPLGDHTGYLLEPVAAEVLAPRASLADGLGLQGAKDIDAGHPA